MPPSKPSTPPAPAGLRTAAPTDPAIRLELPWALLVPDNAKYGVVMKGKRPAMILTARYREAKDKGALVAMGLVKAHQKIAAGRCVLEATFFEPDASRTRDVTNYAKLLCDMLKGIAYTDDAQIHRATYVRGWVDPTNPRVEVEVYPINSLGLPL